MDYSCNKKLDSPTTSILSIYTCRLPSSINKPDSTSLTAKPSKHNLQVLQPLNRRYLKHQVQINCSFTSDMKDSRKMEVVGIAMESVVNRIERMPRLLLEQASQDYDTTPANKSLAFRQNALDTLLKRMNKLGKKADKFAHGIREHVRLGTKISEILKGKLSLGAKIIQVGGVKKVFRLLFTVGERERLLKASQCYLSTTAGPIAGLVFISTNKIAFCSERSIKLSSPDGKMVKVHYKVVIPLRKIKAANQSETVKKPSQKFIELVTVDNFDFWFMGFLNYQNSLKCLQQAVSQAWMSTRNSDVI